MQNERMTLKEITELLDLAMPGKRVLIVEDHLPALLQLRDFWEEAGHSVVGMTGIDAVEGTVCSGRTALTEVFDSFDARDIDVVFMDHYFLSRHFNGALLTRRLMQIGSPKILGMSSDSSANAAMVREGAVGAIRKADLLRQM